MALYLSIIARGVPSIYDYFGVLPYDNYSSKSNHTVCGSRVSRNRLPNLIMKRGIIRLDLCFRILSVELIICEVTMMKIKIIIYLIKK